MSGHGLLLRLFLTPNFFTVLRGLQYFRTYSDNIGITHYIAYRLAEPAFNDELLDKWNLVCHLLVSVPTKSTALESLVLAKSEQSTYFALLTLWFLQCSLNDLSKPGQNPQNFATCQRVLRTVTQIIFNDPQQDTGKPDSSIYSTLSHISFFRRGKVKAHLEPAIVGIGSVLAGVPGLPKLTEIVGAVAVDQGRRSDSRLGGILPYQTGEIGPKDPPPSQQVVPEQMEPSPLTDDLVDEEQEEDVESYGRSLIAARQKKEGETPATGSIHANTIGASASTPSLGIPSLPFARRSEEITIKPSHRVARATQSLSLPDSSKSLNQFDVSLDPSVQSRILRSHYLHSELQFLQTLEAISNKLLVVPKLARVSALRAELTNLNHQLPAEVCLPMWCRYPKHGDYDTDVQSHHRIIRVPPGECVVLNSAERAPYLLIIEILHEDLDFDPSTRSNKELLSRLTQDKSGKKGFRGRATESSQDVMKPSDDITTRQPEAPIIGTIIPPTPLGSEKFYHEEPEEEVDLVEQLYGADLSVRSVNLEISDSIVLPPPPKNKALDVAAWERSGSLPSSPHLNEHPTRSSSRNSTPIASPSTSQTPTQPDSLTLEEYSNRMEAAAIMLAQLNSNLVREPVTGAFGTQPQTQENQPSALNWLPGSGWVKGAISSIPGTSAIGDTGISSAQALRMKLQPTEAAAIRDRIMQEMIALEEQRMARMKVSADPWSSQHENRGKTAEDEGIVRRELNKADPSAAIFSESWTAKKSRIRDASPYGHLANWDCLSCILKTGADLRQEQMAGQLIQEFGRIWKEENCACWVKYFRILITGSNSGLVETIKDAVSIHSIKKAEYAKRLVAGNFSNVSLLDHFTQTYGDPSSAKFARAQRNFAKSLAGYSIAGYLLQIKDRHNGNLLMDREGHIIHIDWGFLLETSPGGNLGFEASPFKLPWEYVDVLGGLESEGWAEFKRLFKEGFHAARKHCDRIITIVELMQKESTLPCFASFGEQTAQRLRDRFQPTLTHSLVDDHCEKLIAASLGSAWTRLYDSYQYYSQGVL